MGFLNRIAATFSIVAYDPASGDLGVAVQSKFLAAGAVVPWAKAKVGAIATQSYANTSYGPKGLELMEKGLSAQEALERLIEEDEERALRQVAIVDARENAAAYTGKDCFEWAGHVVGGGRDKPCPFACQGNILVSEGTVQAMARAFENAEGELADRLVAALEAGQAAGGDSRGRQSAALLVVTKGLTAQQLALLSERCETFRQVRERGGYGGFNDRYVDLRVDDHPTPNENSLRLLTEFCTFTPYAYSHIFRREFSLPIQELKRLLNLYKLYFFKTKPQDLVKIEDDVARGIQEILRRAGRYEGEATGIYDEATKKALRDLCGIENLEERWREDDYIDGVVLDFLRGRFK